MMELQSEAAAAHATVSIPRLLGFRLTIIYDHDLLSKMEEISISEFKAKCLALLEGVRKTKKPLRVTRFGKPVAEIVPPSPEAGPDEWIGSMKDTLKILGDIVSPVINEKDIEALRD
ncbi:MAG TPA: type II toxin-antitoxin system Phd/YefM family antitoxin [Terriglobales bacterium]|nr:type II toxin-antitoxin system Phd/YefM family antitoxin [Terriglobales bacterium]